jgi:hypothetical protein
MRWFSKSPDRRRWPRFKAGVPAIASVVGENEIVSSPVLCHSICEGGAGILGLEGLALGDLVTLELHIPVSKHPIWVDSVVRHNIGGFGVEFASVSDNERNLIRRYCRLQRQEKHQPYSQIS